MGSRIGDDDEVMAEINITPFVDIILVILIIFMVTTSAINQQGIEVKLPEAANASTTDSVSLGLTLTKDGLLLLDGTRVDEAGLRAGLRAAKETSDDVVTLIAADKEVEHGRVVWLIDVVKSEGIGNFAINISKQDAVPPDPALVRTEED